MTSISQKQNHRRINGKYWAIALMFTICVASLWSSQQWTYMQMQLTQHQSLKKDEQTSNPIVYNGDTESRNIHSRKVNGSTPPFWTPFHQYMEQIRECESCPVVDKWEPYFKAYHTHFHRYRGKKVTMVEVGVQSGGSLQMWRAYFGPGLRYYGIDIDPNTQTFENDWATIWIGDQSDPEFWTTIREQLPEVDIFLDDGGHRMNQQLTTFHSMFSKVSPNGVYVCEDLATSYSKVYGGNPLEEGSLQGPNGSFIELSKKMIDWMNCYFAGGDFMNVKGVCSDNFDQGVLGDVGFKDTAYSLHFYSQILMIEKERVIPPQNYMRGGYSFRYGDVNTVWDGNHYAVPAVATAAIKK